MKLAIRSARLADAEEFWQMNYELDYETKYMMYEPGERTKNIDRVKAFINGAVNGDNLLLFAADDDKIVGFISAQRGSQIRVRHTAYIVVGIRRAYQCQGIGSMFFKELDKWAIENNITRLELTVMCQNEIAKHLYEKNGFVIEGLKKKTMLVDGEYIDEYCMAKLF